MEYKSIPRPDLIYKKGESVIITKDLKGVLVLATPKEEFRSNWLILISSVETVKYAHSTHNIIYRHLSFDLNKGKYYFANNPHHHWGFSDYYDYYIATDEQKQLIKNVLRQLNKKFVKVLNRVIDR